MRKVSLDKIWRVGLILSIVILLTTGAFAFQRLFSLSDANEQISHTYEVIDEINTLFSVLKDAETGQRGFLLIGDESYLAPYNIAVTEIPKTEARLRTLVSDNESQKNRAAKLEGLIHARLEIAGKTISLTRSGKREEALNLVNNGDGKRLMEEIRNIIDKMQQEEETLLQSRVERVRDVRITSYLIIAAVIIISLILSLVAYLTNKEFERRNQRLRNEMQEREAAEKALQEGQTQLRAITNTVPEIVWSARADGYTDYFNDRWYEYTGMARDGNTGWNWTEYLHPEDIEHTKVVWNRSVASGAAYEIEYRFRRSPDGAYRWFIGRALPVKDETGKITRWFGSCTDVDDQKRLMQEREELLDSERAARTEVERAIRLKDEFVATLSHELRSPMNVIMGWSRILKTGRFDKEAIEKGLETIERNTSLQAQLISDLLDMNRLISGKLRLNVSPIDLGDVIENAVRSNIQTAEAKRIKIQTLIDSSVSNIMGDSARLEQVVWNLLSNALKFTPKDGHIKIITQKINSSVEVIVSDDGEGIEHSFLPYIFDRYRQADGSSSRTHGGLGIGLSIVKNLVELHGGTIRVASDGKGKGATFTIKLPIAPVTKSSPDIQRSDKDGHDVIPEQTLSGVHVLVIDDEMDSRELVKRILEDCEAKVTVAVSADDALLIYQHNKPDIILSDIGMPGKDGYQFIRELRGLEGGKRTPAVALTAFARLEDKTRALMEGYNAHIAKPVDATELIATLASLINLSED